MGSGRKGSGRVPGSYIKDLVYWLLPEEEKT